MHSGPAANVSMGAIEGHDDKLECEQSSSLIAHGTYVLSPSSPFLILQATFCVCLMFYQRLLF